jgi:hypothetical protein
VTLYTHTQSTERGRAVPTTTTTTHGSRDWRGEKNKKEKKQQERRQQLHIAQLETKVYNNYVDIYIRVYSLVVVVHKGT